MDSSLSNNQDFPDIGTLQVNVFSQNNYNPITNATVTIQNTIPQADGTSEQLNTDSSGQTETVSLRTPPLEYSLTPESSMPYSEYTITVSAPGYETTVLTGAQILPDVKAIQDIRLVPLPGTEEIQEQDIDIDPHTLYAEYPPKIPEAEIKTVADTAEIILSQVVIPEYIIVHDGLPAQAISKAIGPVFNKSFKLVSKPAENISKITPISAICTKKSDCCTIPNTQGPIKSPATISPTTCGAFNLRATIPINFAAITIIAKSFSISYDSIFSSPHN